MRSCKSVSFSPKSELVFITNLSSGPYKHTMWFTETELDQFKANMVLGISTVRLNISNRHKEPNVSNILGMEKFLTSHLTEQYKRRRGKLIKEVLKEARWQNLLLARRGMPRSNGVAEQLARISAENSKWARERARAAALFLEQDQEESSEQHYHQDVVQPT